MQFDVFRLKSRGAEVEGVGAMVDNRALVRHLLADTLKFMWINGRFEGDALDYGPHEWAWDSDEVAELVAAEEAGVTLPERLVGTLGREIAISTTSGAQISGTLVGVAERWILIDADQVSYVVLTQAIAQTGPLGPPRNPVPKIPLGVLLRRIRARASWVVLEAGLILRGQLGVMSADHFELITDSVSINIVTATLVSLRCQREALTGIVD